MTEVVRPTGLGFAARGEVADVVRWSDAARREGLDSVWIHDSYFERDSVTYASAVAAQVPDIRVAMGALNPFTRHPVLVAMTLGIPAAILTESGLSFLGLGVQPPHATWGNILNEGKDAIELAWWLSLYPGLAILVTVLSYNLLGEGIRDALDPRLRQSAGRVGGRVR